MKANKKEYQIWLDKSLDDLLWTKSNIKEKVYYGACFTAQQSVEKALKAFLLFKHGSFGKIHDLVKLVDECSVINKDFKQYRSNVAKLTYYYVQSRYPDLTEIDIFTQEDADEALKIAEEMWEFISIRIK